MACKQNLNRVLVATLLSLPLAACNKLISPAPAAASPSLAPQTPLKKGESTEPVLPAEGELGGPRLGATAAQKQAWLAGRAEFFKEYTAKTGLGPHFNEVSCVQCHSLPTPGGGAGIDRAARITLDAENRVQPFERKTLPGLAPLVARPGAPVSLRRPPPLYGVGMLESVADAVIVAGCDPDDRDHDGVHGKVNRAFDGRPGRLGWKAHTTTLDDFTSDAFAGEMGMTNAVHRDPAMRADKDEAPDPEVAATLVTLVAEHVRQLAPPPRAGDHPPGAALFADLGCVACHRPQTAPDVPAFTDLCLHDLGPAFADGIPDNDAGSSEWRTAPLWGLRLRKSYFHDARTDNLDAAVRMHGGEATGAATRYGALDDAKRADLLKFLGTL